MNEERVSNPMHPGEVLVQEWLEPLGMNANQLAKALAVDRRNVYEIVGGKTVYLRRHGSQARPVVGDAGRVLAWPTGRQQSRYSPSRLPDSLHLIRSPVEGLLPAKAREALRFGSRRLKATSRAARSGSRGLHHPRQLHERRLPLIHRLEGGRGSITT